jgi:chromosome segregation ATPase
MIVPVLAIAAAVLLVLVLVLAWGYVRRGDRIRDIEEGGKESLRQVQQVEERLEKKCRHADGLASQLEKAREETRKAKKRAFDLEQGKAPDQQTAEQKELELVQEQVLEELRDKLSAARAEAGQATEEAAELRGRANKLEQELERVRKDLKTRREASIKGKSSEGEKLKTLQKENAALAKQLETARRKARTDDQVYKVTNSKLELAMEKIAAMEKALQSQKGPGSGKNESPEEPAPDKPGQSIET